MDNLPNDPVMLLSFMNMKLRDMYSDKEKMMDDLGLSEDDWNQVETKLAAIDYHYDVDKNQFV